MEKRSQERDGKIHRTRPTKQTPSLNASTFLEFSGVWFDRMGVGLCLTFSLGWCID